MVTIKNGWVEFSFFRPSATNVCVAGDFNGWKIGDVQMKRDTRGNWRARIKVPAGEHRFRYCADGEWYTDYAASGLEPGRFGMDSLLIVPKATPVIKVAKHSEQTEEIFAA